MALRLLVEGDKTSKQVLRGCDIKSSLLFWQASIVVQEQIGGRPACLIDRVVLLLDRCFG